MIFDPLLVRCESFVADVTDGITLKLGFRFIVHYYIFRLLDVVVEDIAGGCCETVQHVFGGILTLVDFGLCLEPRNV